MRDDRERLSVNIHESRKRRVDHEDKANREIVEEALDLYFGDEEGKLQDRIEKEKDEFAEMRETFEELQEQMEEKQQKIEKLEAEQQKIEEEKQDYTEWLDEILDRREAGESARLITDVIKNIEGFSDYRKGADQIQQDLKEQAIEQEREIRSSEFTSGRVDFTENVLYKQAEDDDEDSEDADQNDAGYSLNWDSGTADD